MRYNIRKILLRKEYTHTHKKSYLIVSSKYRFKIYLNPNNTNLKHTLIVFFATNICFIHS